MVLRTVTVAMAKQQKGTTIKVPSDNDNATGPTTNQNKNNNTSSHHVASIIDHRSCMDNPSQVERITNANPYYSTNYVP
jgi:hypothetical protein